MATDGLVVQWAGASAVMELALVPQNILAWKTGLVMTRRRSESGLPAVFIVSVIAIYFTNFNWFTSALLIAMPLYILAAIVLKLSFAKCQMIGAFAMKQIVRHPEFITIVFVPSAMIKP